MSAIGSAPVPQEADEGQILKTPPTTRAASGLDRSRLSERPSPPRLQRSTRGRNRRQKATTGEGWGLAAPNTGPSRGGVPALPTKIPLDPRPSRGGAPPRSKTVANMSIMRINLWQGRGAAPAQGQNSAGGEYCLT